MPPQDAPGNPKRHSCECSWSRSSSSLPSPSYYERGDIVRLPEPTFYPFQVKAFPPLFWRAISGNILFSVFRCLRSNNLLYLHAAMDPIDLIREGKLKRYFRATKKLSAPGIISHITQRAAGKEPLFLEESDYLMMR
jgi:hypothetical protein